jgi:uncharacterized protein
MSLPCFPDFKLLELSDRPTLRPYFERWPLEISESTFANHFIWRQYDQPRFSLIRENLCFRFAPPREPAYFLQPLGEREIPETLQTCLSLAPRLSRIPQSFAERYCGGLHCAPDEDDFDYVYLAADLIELKGKKFDGKRNRIRKFEKTQPWEYVRLGPADVPACEALFEEWLAEKGQAGGEIDAQKTAIQEALLHFRELEMTGGGIVAGGRLAAFSIGERLNGETAVVHIEIVSPRFEGLAQLMNREFVRNEWSDCLYINREQDLGVPGLRKAKLSYHPHHRVEKYHIWG